MSFVRTIQHPGIEIREIDMTEYTSTVTTNNAFVMGFTDKGPIYEYSWITTQSEFIKTYGEPQTEAEKYLYYAVQSILNNGGTPLVARMPYDNKQCKTYRGLKIRYAGVDAKGEFISDWGITPTNALIPLTDVYATLRENDITQEKLAIFDEAKTIIKSADSVIKLETEQEFYLTGCTLGNLLANLAPTEECLEILSANNITYVPIKVKDVDPTGLLLPAKVIENTITSIASGLIEENGVTLNLSDILVESYEQPRGIFDFDTVLSGALHSIYNDPYFADTNREYDAAVDARLLMDDSLGYTNGVFLDSIECQISNEQYDDLAAINTFTNMDKKVSIYGEDIRDANFIVIDKTKSVVAGTGNNTGYFITIIDPYDGLKLQRLLVNPYEKITNSVTAKNSLEYWNENSKLNWKAIYKDQIDTLNSLQRVKNADGLWIGEQSPNPKKANIANAWTLPLTGTYYDESVSKDLMTLFPQIPLADVSSKGPAATQAIIEKDYSSYIIIAVCQTYINPTDGKVGIAIVEQHFGSLYDEVNPQTGRSFYIGNMINQNSKYIEFYKNTYLKPVYGGGMTGEIPIPQFFIKDSIQLKNAAAMVGIDTDYYDTDNIFDNNADAIKAGQEQGTAGLIKFTYDEYISDLSRANIYIFDKINTILYNNHPNAVFTSFAKKESQKTIANTTGLYGTEQGTTMNIAGNFIIDMDRCINFIKNVDDIPMYFVVDAGLSTIAQYCDNVIWLENEDGAGGQWVTQNFDPDNDPDMEDRNITDYTEITTWRKVVEKLDQISREIRRDCMTIIDAPRQLTLDGAAPKIRKSKPQNNWDEVIGNKLKFIAGLNSSYTAGYYNWLRTTDVYTGKSFWLPPTTKVIGNLVYLNAINLPWLAPAGLSYGVVTGVHAVSHNPSSKEQDQIYLKSWNYIRQYPFDGFIIEGQKTTLTKDSAFNRLNVRTLFLDLERYTYNVGRTFKYQVNNAYTREQFVQTLKVKFDDYKLRGGVYDYLIKCDDSNNTPETIDQQELRAAIYVKPARLIEYILVNMVATKTGANLEEIANQ